MGTKTWVFLTHTPSHFIEQIKNKKFNEYVKMLNNYSIYFLTETRRKAI